MSGRTCRVQYTEGITPTCRVVWISKQCIPSLSCDRVSTVDTTTRSTAISMRRVSDSQLHYSTVALTVRAASAALPLCYCGCPSNHIFGRKKSATKQSVLYCKWEHPTATTHQKNKRDMHNFSKPSNGLTWRRLDL